MPFVNYKTRNAYLRQIHDKVKSCNLYKLYKNSPPNKIFFLQKIVFFYERKNETLAWCKFS